MLLYTHIDTEKSVIHKTQDKKKETKLKMVTAITKIVQLIELNQENVLIHVKPIERYLKNDSCGSFS